MSVMRHWIARAPHGDRVARVLDTAEKADHYRDIAWDVTGPFVPEADAGAVEALREIADPKCGHGIAGDGHSGIGLRATGSPPTGGNRR